MSLTENKNRTLSCVRIDRQYFGVLKTPCYPAQYYAGPISRINGGWDNDRNETGLFYGSPGQAFSALRSLLEQERKAK